MSIKVLGALRTYKPSSIEKAYDQLLSELPLITVTTFTRLLVKHVEKGDLNFSPLKSSYLRSKRSKGFPDTIFIGSGEYLSAIKELPKNVKMRGKKKLFIGFPSNLRHSSGLPMHMLAKILEYGSPKNNLVGRPLWAESARDLLKIVNPMFRKRAKQIMKKALS